MIMNNKMKGLLKGLRYISQIFEEDEKELQIGYPTDVKHVAHIGCDGSSVDSLCWMGEYQSTSVNGNTSGKCFDAPTKAIKQLSINLADSPATEPLPESPAKRRHRRRSSASESTLGDEPPSVRDKYSSDRGSRHTRRHHSAGAAADSSGKEPSDGSSRRGRRHSKPAAAAAAASDSSARDIPSIPKQSRRRKSKEETAAAAPVVVAGIP